MQHRTNVMATPASRRKPLDTAANLAATLAQFTVPKLKDGSTAFATNAQPETASLPLMETATVHLAAADASSAAAGAGPAAEAVSLTAEAHAHGESAHPDLLAGNSGSSAAVELSAVPAQRQAVPLTTPVATTEQVSDATDMPAKSVAPQTLGAAAPTRLTHGSSPMASPSAGPSPAPQQTEPSVPRSAARAGERGRTPSKRAPAGQRQQPPFPLRRTVTDPAAGINGAGETSPRQQAAFEEVCKHIVVCCAKITSPALRECSFRASSC